MQTLLSALHDHARRTPDSTAFLVRQNGEWTDLTYGLLERQTNDWARSLLRHNLARGSVMFIVLKHCSTLYPAFLGAMRAGLVPSFLPFPTAKQDPQLYWDSHRALFGRVQPSCILTYADNLAPIRDALDGLDCLLLDVADPPDPHDDTALPPLRDIETPDATALLQHSSGTTGLKKGVALSYGQIARQIRSYAQAIEANAADCIASWLPVYHDMGLITALLLPVCLGCKMVCIDAFDWLGRPDMLLGLIGEQRATLCWLPNFAFNHLVRTRARNRSYDLSSIRAFIDCSEPCRAETFERFQASFEPDGLRPRALQTCYAMAEAVFAVTQTSLSGRPAVLTLSAAALAGHGRVVEATADDAAAIRLLSCGAPVAGVRLRIAAEAGRDVGEIQIAGDFVFTHYHRNAEDTAQAFSDGWYRTGDTGFLQDGELYVCGRIKELLIVHGRNIYAHDVEAVAAAVPGIKPGRAVVFGIHDPLTASEEAILLAETDAGFAGDHAELGRAMRNAVFDRLELAVKKVRILPPGTLVKTTSGKISRKDNKQRYLADQP